MGWFIVDGHEDIATALLEAKDRDFGAPAPPGRRSPWPTRSAAAWASSSARSSPPRATGRARRPTEAAERQMRCYEDLLEKHAKDLFRIESKGDLSLCRAGGPIGLLHLMEGADPVRSPARALALGGARRARRRPAWNTPNRYSGGTKDDQGVTRRGPRAARRDARAATSSPTSRT